MSSRGLFRLKSLVVVDDLPSSLFSLRMRSVFLGRFVNKIIWLAAFVFTCVAVSILATDVVSQSIESLWREGVLLAVLLYVTGYCFILHARCKVLQVENERLRAIQKQHSTFLEQLRHAISHDLGESVRKIGVFSAKIVDRIKPGRDTRVFDYLDRVQDASDRLQQMLSMLTEYLQTSAQEPEATFVDLNELFQKIVLRFSAQIENNTAIVEIGDLPRVWADVSALETAFTNIFENALKYVDADRNPHIEVSAESHPDGSWSIRVRDNGIGFDPKQKDRVVKIFQRLHPRGVYEGLGTGLAFASRLAAIGGGRLELESEVGKGTCCTVTLAATQKNVPPAFSLATDVVS